MHKKYMVAQTVLGRCVFHSWRRQYPARNFIHHTIFCWDNCSVLPNVNPSLLYQYWNEMAWWKKTHFVCSWLVCKVYGQVHWLFVQYHVEIREIWLEDIGWIIHVQYFQAVETQTTWRVFQVHLWIQKNPTVSNTGKKMLGKEVKKELFNPTCEENKATSLLVVK